MINKSQFTESQVDIVNHLRQKSEHRGMWIGCILTLITIIGIAIGIMVASKAHYTYSKDIKINESNIKNPRP